MSTAEYYAARRSAVVVERSDRGVLRVFGRDPAKMIHGLVTNDVLALAPGHSVYAAMLTPKGRMIADLRVMRRESDVLLEADSAALPAVRENLAHHVPPLFARSEDVSGEYSVLGVYGPSCDEVLQRALATVPSPVHLMVTEYAGVPGRDVVVAGSSFATYWAALLAAGARPAGRATLEVLRIEAGSPRWGAELDPDVIPLEAGIGERAISTTKGCYTGQEVIIRILHRGHVNRLLRGVALGEGAPPERGTELFRTGEAKAVGRVTSSCWSPRLEQTIALAYVRREVEPGSVLGLGSPDGTEARVLELPFPDPAAAGVA